MINVQREKVGEIVKIGQLAVWDASVEILGILGVLGIAS